MSARTLVLSLLAAALLGSSVALVYVQHDRRALFVELRSLEREHDRMRVERGRLQLEASTLEAEDRIEKLAVEKLSLTVPSPERVVLVVE